MSTFFATHGGAAAKRLPAKTQPSPQNTPPAMSKVSKATAPATASRSLLVVNTTLPMTLTTGTVSTGFISMPRYYYYYFFHYLSNYFYTRNCWHCGVPPMITCYGYVMSIFLCCRGSKAKCVYINKVDLPVHVVLSI